MIFSYDSAGGDFCFPPNARKMLEGTFSPLPTHFPEGRMNVRLIVENTISVGSHFPSEHIVSALKRE